MADYHIIDQNPFLLQMLFYPRKQFTRAPREARDLFVTVEEGISVSCRLYQGDAANPWLLYFHGNGEVVSDYDQIALLYLKKGINLAVADYRGYGASEGKPTLSGVVRDAHVIFETIRDQTAAISSREKIWVMGRSLGSISALELAAAHSDSINAVIIESGFISVVKLIKHLGLPTLGLDLGGLEKEAYYKAGSIKIPALLIHGENDHLVPCSQAEELYSRLGSEQKELVTIPGADHNNVLFVNVELYFGSLKRFVKQTDPLQQ